MTALAIRRFSRKGRLWRLSHGLVSISGACLVVVILCVPANAHDPNRHISQYGHTVWRVQDGAIDPAGEITQTADGYLWLGTSNGLLRFGGVKFVPFAPPGLNLPTRGFTFLLGARDGSLWIGMRRGLSRLKDGRLQVYTKPDDNSGISTILEDHEGTIWITRYNVPRGEGPLCRVKGNGLHCYGEADGIPVRYGLGLKEDKSGNIWFGSTVLCRWRQGSAETYLNEIRKHKDAGDGVIDVAPGPSGEVDLSHLLSRSPGYGVVGAPVLNVYASRETSERAAEMFERDLAGYSLLSPGAEKRLNFKMNQIQPLEPFIVGPYSVMAFPANHAPGMGAMLYSIEANGCAIFYGTDTAPLFEQTWQAFREHKMRFDVVILDHTWGPEQSGDDHLSARQLIVHADRMRAECVLRPHGRIFATHIAHEGNPAHPDLAAFAKQHAYEVAYDGLTLTI